MGGRTFEELAAVDLAGCDLESDNMALQSDSVSKRAFMRRARAAGGEMAG